MTNEEMAIQIQLGHKECYAELWKCVQRLMVKILNAKLSHIELPNYISHEDMQQELYFAFCNAVQAYDDTKPYKFTSYLNYQIIGVIRTALPKRKVQEISYNIACSEDGDCDLIELIEDETAKKKIYDVEITDLQRIVREEVAELPNIQRKIITEIFFYNCNSIELSAKLGVSGARVGQIKKKALNMLSQRERLKDLYEEYVAHSIQLEELIMKANSEWRNSDERTRIKTAIRVKRELYGETISHREEQKLIEQAKNDYISEYINNSVSLCLPGQ
ncbi:MAG: sigma-70 family RNA polymerase sigma factor [Ruminococcus sp.]